MADGNKETITVTGPGGITSEIGNNFEVPTPRPQRGASWFTRIAAIAAVTASLAVGLIHPGKDTAPVDPPAPPAPVQKLNP